MLTTKEKLSKILPQVQKPSRYVGGEYGEIVKDKQSVDVSVAFCFPDTYEIGMSHLGMKILYGLYNSLPYCRCERVFAPWTDMEERLRAENIPLYALESGDPLEEFDIIAFTLLYEMCYTNVLNMLDMAGIPVRACDRDDSLKGIVMAGGPCTCNPEPMADFVDLFQIGEGEEMGVEVLDLYRRAKRENMTKTQFLRLAADIEGVYVPSLYEPQYDGDGNLVKVLPLDGVKPVVNKRIVKDLDTMYFPESIIVPSTEIVHDRVSIEIQRGCIRGCRFCQAGHTYRPIRQKSVETIEKQTKTLIENTGYDEVSLSSLSTSDYKQLGPLCDRLIDFCDPRHVSLSIPSQRLDKFNLELMERIQRVRKSGLTFAPEAGSQRLRDVINKNITESDLLNAAAIAFSGGWNSVKLYYMIGLPTETNEDLDGIVNLSRKVVWTWRQHTTKKDRGVKVTASASSFVPKPHTPFQWVPQATLEEICEKQAYLREKMRVAKGVTFNYHDSKTSVLEGVLSRGDRRIGAVIYEAWKRGCSFDSWDELFKPDIWDSCFADLGIRPSYYANRRRFYDECLPWDHIFHGVSKEHLWKEYRQSLAGVLSSDCSVKCSGCGATKLMGGKCDA